MKVLALTEGPNHVCYRYRLEAFAPALAAQGATLESLPLVPHTMQRGAQLREAATADVVILQRKLLPLWQLRILRRAARTLIYDFDDALFCRDSYARKRSTSWGRLAHFWATIYQADLVTAGNAYLARQASLYVEPQRVHLLPTCVDPSLYPLAAHERSDGHLALAWIGQHSTLPCLNQARPMLAAASRALPRLELRVICNQFPQLEGVRVVPRQWSAAHEARELASADVGLSWLPNDPWSLGKCGLKVLQYMAAGLPVVANPVGMNLEMVRHGRTGFLAATRQEWVAALARLAADPALRRTMGAAGRHFVERHYSVAAWSGRFVDLVRLGADAAAALPQPPLGLEHVAGGSRILAPASVASARSFAHAGRALPGEPR